MKVSRVVALEGNIFEQFDAKSEGDNFIKCHLVVD
jgi:hypothetical protein